MQVKMQSLFRTILAMSLILQTTGCIINTSDTPSIAQEDTSPLPSATDNVNNIEGKWRFEQTSQNDNGAITNKATIKYKIISSSQDKIKLEVPESNGTSSTVIYRRV